MSGLSESLNLLEENLSASLRWLRVTNVLALLGMLFAFFAGVRHWRQRARKLRGEDPGKNSTAFLAICILAAAITTGLVSIWNRYVEVNHFPSQTMSETLVMFSWLLLVAMLVLHYAQRLGELGYGWAVIDDALLLAGFAGVLATNAYSGSLPTAQKDLPPALQSYWFSPHLVALIFSYATLGLAGIACIQYFAIRFWSGVHSGGFSRASQWCVLLGMLLIPFAQVVTIPVLLIVGLVFLWMRRRGLLPSRETLSDLELTLDRISHKAFCVGIPFLTAGLFMGAFWAQEAWANYWGWDSKENSALITWLVYMAYSHLRMLGGYRGEKAMAVLAGGALSIFLTFQVFGYLPDSQKSLHRYTDDGAVPREGVQGAKPTIEQSARLEETNDER